MSPKCPTNFLYGVGSGLHTVCQIIACNSIDKIRAPTGNFPHGRVADSCDVAL